MVSNNRRPYTEDDERAMAAIYETSPAGLRALTAKFGGSLASASAALRRQGVTKFKAGGPRRYEAPHSAIPAPAVRPNSNAAHVSGETAAEIVRQWTGGAKDLRYLGRLHGMNKKTVQQILQVAGLLPAS